MDIYIYLTKVQLTFCHAPVIFGFLTEFYLAKIGDIEWLGRGKVCQEMVRRIFISFPWGDTPLIGKFGCGRGKIFSFLRGVFSERGRSRLPCWRWFCNKQADYQEIFSAKTRPSRTPASWKYPRRKEKIFPRPHPNVPINVVSPHGDEIKILLNNSWLIMLARQSSHNFAK